MPKKFFKKRTCSECGTPGLFPKKSWKLMKRQGMTAVCTKCMFKPGYVYFPYIPLMEPVRI